MDKYLCIIDDRFETTVTIVKALLLYCNWKKERNEMEENINFHVMFIQLCEKSRVGKIPNENQCLDMICANLDSFNDYVNYSRIIINDGVNDDSKTESEAQRVMGKIRVAMEEKWGRNIAHSDIMFLMDIIIQDIDMKRYKDIRKSISMVLTDTIRSDGYKYYVYTEYAPLFDIPKKWEKSFNSYYRDYNKEILAKSDLDPRYFRLDKGDIVFNELLGR